MFLTKGSSYKVLGDKTVYLGQDVKHAEIWHRFQRVDGLCVHCVVDSSVDQDVQYWEPLKSEAIPEESHSRETEEDGEKSCIATRFRVGIPFVEEYGDSELDHWSFQSEYFECLSDAIAASKRSNDYDPPVIHFEVFDPATKEWEHLFDVPVESAENIEVVSDL